MWYYQCLPFSQYFSICSRLFPFVSGTRNQQKITAASASRAYNQYVKELPRCLISERNVILTNNVAAQLKQNEMLTPTPRRGVGKISEHINAKIGPIPMLYAKM